MTVENKKRLYEAIMSKISKTVKKALNESDGGSHIKKDPANTKRWIRSYVSELDTCSKRGGVTAKTCAMERKIANTLYKAGLKMPFVVSQNDWQFRVMIPVSAIKEVTDTAISEFDDAWQAQNPKENNMYHTGFSNMDGIYVYKEGARYPYRDSRYIMPKLPQSTKSMMLKVKKIAKFIDGIYSVESIRHNADMWVRDSESKSLVYDDFILIHLKVEGELDKFRDDMYHEKETEYDFEEENRMERRAEQSRWDQLAREGF